MMSPSPSQSEGVGNDLLLSESLRYVPLSNKSFPTPSNKQRTSFCKESKSDCVLDKAITSAPHFTNVFAVSRPIPAKHR